MAFTFRAPTHVQELASLALVGLGLALGSTAAFADLWSRFVEATTPAVQLVLTPWALHQVWFWGLVGLFALVDRTGRPTHIADRRIQSGRPRQPPRAKALRVLALNQLVFAPLMLTLMAGALHLRGWEASAVLPGPWQVALELLGLAVCAEVVFFASHWMLHRPWWMKRVHKVHHEFRTTSAMAAEYAHPFEFCVGNFGTLAVGVVLIGPSLPAIYLFEVVALTQIVTHHSGFAVPWAPWSVPHDWHHYTYTQVFSSSGWLDRLFGTYGDLAEMEDGEVR